MLRSLLITLILLLVSWPMAAQEVTPAIPNPAPTAVPDDPRLTICSAPALDGFAPHIIRPGERLADLLTGVPNISVTQLAALNCLDDPAALPVGAVVWIPAQAIVDAPADAADTTPTILSFVASDLAVQNQAHLTFSWQVTGREAYFYACPGDPDSDCRRPATVLPVPLTHEISVGGFNYATRKRFRLEVRGGGESLTDDITIDVTCSQQWLGPLTGQVACSQEPAIAVFAAWQPFEGGVMIWFSDSRQIWVLTNHDNRAQVFPDTYADGEANPADNAPNDRYTPERGFGKVWQALGGAASPLGWAYTPETGFDSARQAAGSRSFTSFIQGPGATVYAVTLIPQLEIGLWTQVAG